MFLLNVNIIDVCVIFEKEDVREEEFFVLVFVWIGVSGMFFEFLDFGKIIFVMRYLV